MKKYFFRGILFLAVIGVLLGAWWFHHRYATADQMGIPITEYAPFEYPEDPAERSIYFGQYAKRKLTLVKKDETHFDFLFEPSDQKTAKVIFKNIDVSLMTPSEPEWTKADPNLELIAFTDRQWNRQQVSFDPHGPYVELLGGDGFEKEHLYSAELAKNCLNAGLWEVLLFTREKGQKTLYYQGWFTFPLGHYKRIFERNTAVSYLKYWYRLEHWKNPAGTVLDLAKLRDVIQENKVDVLSDPNERRIFTGEQVRKARTTNMNNLRTWADVVSGAPIQFAAFIPPGRYSDRHPWGNEYWRFSRFNGAVFRWVRSRAKETPLGEIELLFSDKEGKTNRMIVSGVDINSLPQLAMTDYPKGLYMPMGIGVPPFYQIYEVLEKNPPHRSGYFSVLLDEKNRWINHHDAAIDGSVLHRDEKDPMLVHLYLLSYERHTLVGHYVVSVPELPGMVLAVSATAKQH